MFVKNSFLHYNQLKRDLKLTGKKYPAGRIEDMTKILDSPIL